MKPLILKQNIQPESPKVSIDMAEQIADRAARRAADDVSRESMESFNRFQEQNKQQNQQPVETESSSVGEDNDPGVDLFDKTTANSITKTVRAFKSMQEVFAPPPDPIRSAMENGISQMAAKFVENTLLGGSGDGIVTKKPSFLIDVMNTAAAHGFGESLGNNLPQVIQSLSSAIGQKKTQELVDNINSKMSSGNGGNSDRNVEDNSSNIEKQKNMVLALDSNNPEHIKQYASAMGLSEKAAKGMLQIHQDDILDERKNSYSVNNSNSNSNSNVNIGNVEIVQAIGTLIQEMTGMKNTINSLQSEISGIRTKKIDEDVGMTEPESADRKWTDENEQINLSKSSVSVTQKSVNLFSTPIKVDIDQIKGNNDPFFKETPKDNIVNEQKESVLEEVIDSEGKSTFKMSDEKEQPKIEKNITEKKIEKPVEKPIDKSIDKPIEKEDDKKKENNIESVKLDESKKDESIEELSQTKEILKSEEKLHRRRLIRKPVPIRKDVSDLPSHVTEHYDIDNNLMI